MDNKKSAEIISVGNEAPLDRVKIFFTLVQLRNRDNITQQDLADDLDITQSMLSMIETGRRKPNPELLQKIAEHFKVEVEDLYLDAPTVEMALQMIAEDVTAMYEHREDTLTKDERHYLLQLIRTLKPMVLAEETVVTKLDKDGNQTRESVHRKLAQHGIGLPEKP